ncbi:hypothetical protein [Hymenobacter sp. B81]|uniref:hypothetical protein n=1 Tax=Hymenobacter sp. B81 TaxID=3344878 RepID=UPI0037DD2602
MGFRDTFKQLVVSSIKVVAGGPATRTRGVGMRGLFDALLDNSLLQDDPGTKLRFWGIQFDTQDQAGGVARAGWFVETTPGGPRYAEAFRYRNADGTPAAEQEVCYNFVDGSGVGEVWVPVQAPTTPATITRLATRAAAGIAVGDSLTVNDDANGATLLQAFAPENPPVVAFAGNPQLREPGASTTIKLEWEVAIGTNPVIENVTVHNTDQGTTVEGELDVTAAATGASTFYMSATDAGGLTTTKQVTVRVVPYRYIFFLADDPLLLSDGDLSVLLQSVQPLPGYVGPPTPGTREFNAAKAFDTRVLAVGATPKYIVVVYEEANNGVPVVTQNAGLNTGYLSQVRTLNNSVGAPRSMRVVRSGDKQVGNTSLKFE